MKTDFNRFGVFGAENAAPAKDSWWTRPDLQHDRKAFEAALVTEELRMLGGKFGGRGKPFTTAEIADHHKRSRRG